MQRVLPGGRVRVALGDLAMVCRAEDLCAVKGPQASRQGPSAASRVVPASSARPPLSLDLHGMTVVEAVQAVERHLNSVVLAGMQHTKIQHGLGTGRLQAAVHSLLGSLSVVRAYRLNDRNPGETDVYF